MTAEEFYRAIGGNYEEMIAKCCKEERILKYLRMFLEDTSYEELKTAMAAKDWKTAFTAAHTLKGVAQNLSLAAASKAVVEITEALRSENGELAESLLPSVIEAMDLTLENLRVFISENQ